MCCNCGKNGHLDYECHEIYNSVYAKSKPFVNNYIAIADLFASDKKKLAIDIRLSAEEGNVLSSKDGNEFLQDLSNNTKARLELVTKLPVSSLTVSGSNSQCKAVLDQVYSFVQTKVCDSGSFHKHKKKNVTKSRRRI